MAETALLPFFLEPTRGHFIAKVFLLPPLEISFEDFSVLSKVAENFFVSIFLVYNFFIDTLKKMTAHLFQDILNNTTEIY